MKKKVVFLIGIILLCMIVWGATYLGLQYCEKHFESRDTKTSSVVEQVIYQKDTNNFF